ncbi:MAG: hypothetical protein GHCLOJNM_01036 [bacterium]|nr:hypothetical protein [bacterium]
MVHHVDEEPGGIPSKGIERRLEVGGRGRRIHIVEPIPIGILIAKRREVLNLTRRVPAQAADLVSVRRQILRLLGNRVARKRAAARHDHGFRRKCLPDAGSTILASRQDFCTVGGERNGLDPSPMRQKSPDLGPVHSVPEFRGPVVTPR